MPGEKEMMEHTKGVWKAEAYNSRMGSLITFGDMSKGEAIGIVYAQRNPYEAQANARLIAAAPELLEALKEAEEFVDRHSESWYTSGQELLKKIRTAIAATRTS